MGFDPALFTTSALISSLFFVLYEGRPRGGLTIDQSLLDVKKSNVDGAGLGLFAKEDLPADLCLGTYPGRVWPAGFWLRFKGATVQDVATASNPDRTAKQEKARVYVWRLENGNILDPTDSDGKLPDVIPGVGLEVSTLLCRINEPSRGFDTNVVTEESGDELVFRTEREVQKGEELFLDYGPFYDRSGYSSNVLGTLTFPDD